MRLSHANFLELPGAPLERDERLVVGSPTNPVSGIHFIAMTQSMHKCGAEQSGLRICAIVTTRILAFAGRCKEKARA
jgi:hypothetical protein